MLQKVGEFYIDWRVVTLDVVAVVVVLVFSDCCVYCSYSSRTVLAVM